MGSLKYFVTRNFVIYTDCEGYNVGRTRKNGEIDTRENVTRLGDMFVADDVDLREMSVVSTGREVLGCDRQGMHTEVL